MRYGRDERWRYGCGSEERYGVGLRFRVVLRITISVMQPEPHNVTQLASVFRNADEAALRNSPRTR